MRLLLFNQKTDTNDAGLGVAIDWIMAFAKRVERLYVITHEAGSLPTLPNGTIFSLGKERGYSRLRRLLEFYKHLFRLLWRDHIDACFVHMVPIFAIMAAPVLKWKRIPMVQWYTHKATPRTLRIAHRVVDKVATASEDSFRLPSHKVEITGHGIDTSRFVPPPTPRLRESSETFTILSVARVSPIKRYETLLEAAQLLLKNEREFRVFIVGGTRSKADEEYLQHLQIQKRRLGLSSSIQFVGPLPREELLSWYRKADVFINLSDTDSVDKAVLEAMSCGVPFLTSNTSFRFMPPDLCEQLLVPKGDARSLEKSIIRISEWSKEYRDQTGKRLRQIVVEHHNLEGLIDKLMVMLSKSNSLSNCSHATGRGV